MNQLNLFTPANVVGFFETIEELADFNFIPVRSILFKIFPFLADWETDYSYLLEHKVFTRLGALLVTACVLLGTLVVYKVL